MGFFKGSLVKSRLICSQKALCIDGVAGRAGQRGSWGLIAHWTTLVRGLVIRHRDRTGDGHVTRVGHQVAVSDHITHRIVGRRRGRLDHRQRRARYRHGLPLRI